MIPADVSDVLAGVYVVVAAFFPPASAAQRDKTPALA